ncbi:PIN domain-containing protein [Moorellaceae bacterium AZ2]
MIVCLDTHILIWGIRGEAKAGQEFQIVRTKSLLKKLEEERHRIIIPSPVLAEFLLGVPYDRYAAIMSVLNKFIIAPFDAKAAFEFARLWKNKNKGRSLAEEVRLALNGRGREAIKVDCQIVSIALSRGVDVIYSHDEGVKHFAEGEIRVLEVPPAEIQEEFSFIAVNAEHEVAAMSNSS